MKYLLKNPMQLFPSCSTLIFCYYRYSEIMQCIVRITTICAFIASLLFTADVVGQERLPSEFSTAALRIASQTDNAYRLVRIGSNNAPSILAVNHSPLSKTLSETARTDRASVRNFAQNEALFIASNVLELPESSILSEVGTAKTGSLWLSSYA